MVYYMHCMAESSFSAAYNNNVHKKTLICHDTANIKLCDITVKFKMGLRSKGAVPSAKV